MTKLTLSLRCLPVFILACCLVSRGSGMFFMTSQTASYHSDICEETRGSKLAEFETEEKFAKLLEFKGFNFRPPVTIDFPDMLTMYHIYPK